jgi:hypothetical protein
MKLEAPSARRYDLLPQAREAAEAGIREAHLLEAQKGGAILGQSVLANPFLDLNDFADAFEKPRLETASGMNLRGG